MTGDYINPSQESDSDVIRKSTSFRALALSDGWYTVQNQNDQCLDSSGRGLFTEGDAITIANALNFYLKAQILNGNIRGHSN